MRPGASMQPDRRGWSEYTMSNHAGLNNAVFAGVRIVELAQFVFVPAAGAVFADLGAEVIKIEAVTGDPYRTLRIADGRQTKSANLSMEQNNRGKKSFAIDLKHPEGRELLLKLIDTADIFLTSLRPGALERLALGPEQLRARNPRLIYVRGNGFGFRGPDANRPGYDASAFWARGGFAHVLTPLAQSPIRPRPALGDHASAMNIAFGMAGALFNRERTGKGSLVEVSLLASAMWILSADVALSQAVNENDAARFSREGRYPLTRPYETGDERWIQLMFLDPERYWPELCRRVGRSNLLTDPRFVDGEHRAENGDALSAEFANAFRSKTMAEWRTAFAGWDAPWEMVQTISEVAADPQVVANGYLFKVQVEDGTDVTVVAGPVAFNGSAVPAEPRRSPDLGQHSSELLRSLGVNTDQLQEFKKRNIVR
jgi:crotonobetainyl-CoA:carnitine CoA-transferase CaiB-like acyl-CoA transferase